MDYSEVLCDIRARHHRISPDELLDGTLDTLIQTGLLGVTLCWYGGLRSRISAEGADEHFSLPFVYLSGGCNALHTKMVNRDRLFPRMMENLSYVSSIPVILESHEWTPHIAILEMLPNTSFYDMESVFFRELANTATQY